MTTTNAPVAQTDSAAVDRGDPQGALEMLETGVKVIDLLTPMLRGGMTGIVGPSGAGKLVLLGELARRVTAAGGRSIWISRHERPEQRDDFHRERREMGLTDAVEGFDALAGESPSLHRQLVAKALARAETQAASGQDVLVIVDWQLTRVEGVAALLARPRSGAITTALYHVADDSFDEYAPAALPLDSRIVFHRTLFRAGIYPAIDPLASTSRLLESSCLDERHRRVAQASRDLLAQGHGAHENFFGHLTDWQGGATLLGRARRLQAFLSQPFFVAEPWIGIPGEHVPLAETLTGAEALLGDVLDGVAPRAFYLVGTLAQALQRAPRGGDT